MTADLTARLRAAAPLSEPLSTRRLLTEAADTLDTVTAEHERLRAQNKASSDEWEQREARLRVRLALTALDLYLVSKRTTLDRMVTPSPAANT